MEKLRSRFQLEPLEPRVLLSAEAGAASLAGGMKPPDPVSILAEPPAIEIRQPEDSSGIPAAANEKQTPESAVSDLLAADAFAEVECSGVASPPTTDGSDPPLSEGPSTSEPASVEELTSALAGSTETSGSPPVGSESDEAPKTAAPEIPSVLTTHLTRTLKVANAPPAAPQAEMPDLVVSAANAPSTVAVGGEITLSWTVANQGSVTASEDWEDWVFLSDKPDRTGQQLLILQYQAAGRSPLAAGSSYTETKTVTVPF